MNSSEVHEEDGNENPSSQTSSARARSMGTESRIHPLINSSITSVSCDKASDLQTAVSRPPNDAPIKSIFPLDQVDETMLQKLFSDLLHRDTRPHAILELCKHINRVPQLGALIYWQPAVLCSLLVEITRHYPIDHGYSLNPDTNEVICAIVALLQRTILNRDVRLPFLSTYIPFYLLPYLQQTAQTREAEQLRVSLLGLYATAASKVPVELMERYLLLFNPFPSAPCPRASLASQSVTQTSWSVGHGGLYDQTVAALGTCSSEVGKTMALVLLARLLTSPRQRAQIGSDPHRFQHLMSSLNSIVTYMARKFQHLAATDTRAPASAGDTESPMWILASSSFDRAKRLFRFTLDCLYRLTEEQHMCVALRVCLPVELRSRLFTVIFDGDRDCDQWLEALWSRLKLCPAPALTGVANSGHRSELNTWPERETDSRI